MKRIAVVFAILAVFVAAPATAGAKVPLDCCAAA